MARLTTTIVCRQLAWIAVVGLFVLPGVALADMEQPIHNIRTTDYWDSGEDADYILPLGDGIAGTMTSFQYYEETVTCPIGTCESFQNVILLSYPSEEHWRAHTSTTTELSLGSAEGRTAPGEYLQTESTSFTFDSSKFYVWMWQADANVGRDLYLRGSAAGYGAFCLLDGLWKTSCITDGD